MSFPPISGCVHADVVGAQVRWVWDTLSTPGGGPAAWPPSADGTSTIRRSTPAYEALDAAVRAISTYPRWLEQDQVEKILDETLATLT